MVCMIAIIKHDFRKSMKKKPRLRTGTPLNIDKSMSGQVRVWIATEWFFD